MQTPPQAYPARGPTPEQVALYQREMASGDPRRVAAARAFAMKLQEEMVKPAEYDIQVVNGVPVYLPKNPGAAPMQIAGVPAGVQSRTLAPQEMDARYSGGTIVQRNPLGVESIISKPPEGYQGGPGGMAPIQGGPNDPGARQKPAQGYEWAGDIQRPVGGGGQDPNSQANRLTALREFRMEVKPILDGATALKRNIDSIRVGMRQQNGSGDIAMINGVQKLIDEGVVREGDVTTQLRAQGIEGGLAGLTSYLTSTGRFTPEIRDKIAKTGEDLYSSVNSTYRERAAAYRGIVNRTYGADAFNDVIPPETINALGWGAQPQAQPNAQPSQPGAGAGAGVGGRPADPVWSAWEAEKKRRAAAKRGAR
jgi:hypothetical protein